MESFPLRRAAAALAWLALSSSGSAAEGFPVSPESVSETASFDAAARAPIPEEDAVVEIVATGSLISERRDLAPVRVTVLRPQDWNRQANRTVGEALREAAGIGLDSYGGIGALSDLRLRGTTGPQILTMLNGMPLNTAADGVMDLSLVPLGSIEAIEIHPGAASAFFGADALGGVVHLVTADPDFPSAGYAASFGDYATQQQDVRASLPLPGGTGVGGSWGQLRSSGFRPNSDYARDAWMGNAIWNPGGMWRLSMTGLRTRSTQGVPGSVYFPSPNARQEEERGQAGLNLRVEPMPHVAVRVAPWWFESVVSYSDRNLSFFDPNAFNFSRSAVRSRSAGGSVLGDWDFELRAVEGKGTVTGGLFTRSDRANNESYSGTDTYGYDVAACGSQPAPCLIRSEVFDGYGAYEAQGHAVVVQTLLDLRGRASLLAAVRYDTYAGAAASPTPAIPPAGVSGSPAPKFSAVSPMIGLRLSRSPDRALRFSVGRAFRAPTLNELYFRDSYGDEGNPWLRPEDGLHYELSHERKWVLERAELSFAGSLYFEKIENLIQWRPIDATNPFGGFRPINVKPLAGQRAGTTLRGADVTATWAGRVADVHAVLSYVEALDLAKNTQLPFRPRLRLRAGVTLHPTAAVSIDVTTEAVDRRGTGFTSPASLPPYSLWSVKARFGGYFVSVENVFDRSVQAVYGFPLPGRFVSAGFEFGR